MVVKIRNTGLAAEALAYVIALYHELNVENGAPTLGTQNQAVEFILADPELTAAVGRWAQGRDIEEASTRSPQRLARDALYERVRACLDETCEPVFVPRRPLA